MPLFKPEKAKEADRGKWAEKQVQDFLEGFSAANATFDWLRYPDARSAMGRMKAMPADFEFFAPGCFGLIEVKQTEHKFRLSRSKVTQLPMMRKRYLAGGLCLILVYHTPLGAWRCVPIDHLDPSSTSWDLSDYSLHSTVADTLRGFIYD